MKNEYYLRPEGNKIFMCCGKANCPNVEMSTDGNISISDDYGNKVVMKKEEASLISEAINDLEKSNLSK